MSLPNITYQNVVDIILSSMKSSSNVDSNYDSLDSRFKANWSKYVAMPVWWDSAYTNNGYRGSGTDKRGDYSNLHTTNNNVTITSNSIINKVTSDTINSQLNSFLSSLGITPLLNSIIRQDKFLWFLNNLYAYYKTRVRWASSIFAQDIVPIVYLSSATITTPFYPSTHRVDATYTIKATQITDLIDVFSPVHAGIYLYTVTYNYSFYHDRG